MYTCEFDALNSNNVLYLSQSYFTDANSTRNAGRADQWLGVTVRSGGPGKMAVVGNIYTSLDLIVWCYTVI